MDFAILPANSVHMSGEQTTFLNLFGDGLDPDNRWLKLSRSIPWDAIEAQYGSQFDRSRGGKRPLSARIAFGSLLVQQRQRLTDVETVAFIQENPYVQAFLGYASFSAQRPFDPSLLTHFRKRFCLENLQDINEMIVQRHRASSQGDDDPPHAGTDAPADEQSPGDQLPPSTPEAPPEGAIMMDATCVPADIAYPTEIHLLHHGREITEGIIDELHAPHIGQATKPRTYRQKARQAYLRVAKSKKITRKKARKACRQQLRYLKRNLANIDRLVAEGAWDLRHLRPDVFRKLLIVHELFRQQSLLNRLRNPERSVPDRLVSIGQPHVRPMVRGKAGNPVEFGAKIAVAHDGGFAFLERLSWDAYHEAADLINHVDLYRQRHGHYPGRVLADKIYRTRSNRQWCTERGIRLAGLGPGRPLKDLEQRRAIERSARDDEADRQPIEGVFGRCKRRFGLSRILTRLPQTSACSIALVMIILNLERIIYAYLQRVFILIPTRYSRILCSALAEIIRYWIRRPNIAA
jgi:hypothetical protein